MLDLFQFAEEVARRKSAEIARGRQDLDAATARMETWKHDAMEAARVALVKAGLAEYAAGRPYFGSDNVPETESFGGQGIIGSVVNSLRTAGVICDYYGDHPEQGIRHGRRNSIRPASNARKVNLYQFPNRAMAVEFLARRGIRVEVGQRELSLGVGA
jgi:hypothetical protein